MSKEEMDELNDYIEEFEDKEDWLWKIMLSIF